MAEIATFLLEHLGLPALIIVFGFVADYVSTPELKKLALERLNAKSSRRPGTKFGKDLLSSFLTDFLYRIFDKKLSWRFFERSAIVSVSLLVLFFSIQLFFYEDAEDQLDDLAETAFFWIVVAIIVITANIGIDWLSNMATIVLLRLASASGRFLDTVVVIFADLSLTIILFSLLFPLAIVAATLVVVKSTVIEVEAKFVASASLLGDLKDLIPRIGTDKDLKLFLITFGRAEESTSRSHFYLWSKTDKTPQSVLQEFAELAGRFGKARMQITKNATDEKVEMAVGLPREFPSLSLIFAMYSKAFALGNVIRDEFGGAIKLQPVVASYRTLYTAALDDEMLRNVEREAESRLAIKCRGGETKIVDTKAPQSMEAPCEIETAVILRNVSDGDRAVRRAGPPSGGIPISPFFLSSFGSSLIYYFALALFLVGAFFMRLIRRVIEMPNYVETTNKPFTILGLVVFVPAIVLWALLRAIF